MTPYTRPDNTRLPDKGIKITTPDLCWMCGEPSVGWFVTGKVQHVYAVMISPRRLPAKPTYPLGKLSWRRGGWSDASAKLCQRHADMRLNTWPTPTPSVSKAKVRSPKYQAAQMDKGQLSFYDRVTWMCLRVGTGTRNGRLLTAAIERNVVDPDITLVTTRPASEDHTLVSWQDARITGPAYIPMED